MRKQMPPYLEPATLTRHIAVAGILALIGLVNQLMFPPDGFNLLIRWVGAIAMLYGAWLIYANIMRTWKDRRRD